MKLLPLTTISAAVFVTSLALAHDEKAAAPQHQHTMKPGTAQVAGHPTHEGKVMTIKGEIVDLGCYLSHSSKGADHKSCATKCIQGGMPMGLLTANGNLYLLTMNHDNADPFNQAKGMAADMVEITGPTMERAGMKAIEVTSIKTAMAMAPAPASAASGK